METSRIVVYEEIKDDIEPLLKLHRLSIAAGMSVPHVINLLKIGNNNLREIEWIYQKTLERQITLELKK